jgi:hypothetical protein
MEHPENMDDTDNKSPTKASPEEEATVRALRANPRCIADNVEAAEALSKFASIYALYEKMKQKS